MIEKPNYKNDELNDNIPINELLSNEKICKICFDEQKEP
jgi:hypothetical protein